MKRDVERSGVKWSGTLAYHIAKANLGEAKVEEGMAREPGYGILDTGTDVRIQRRKLRGLRAQFACLCFSPFPHFPPTRAPGLSSSRAETVVSLCAFYFYFPTVFLFKLRWQ